MRQYAAFLKMQLDAAQYPADLLEEAASKIHKKLEGEVAICEEQVKQAAARVVAKKRSLVAFEKLGFGGTKNKSVLSEDITNAANSSGDGSPTKKAKATK
jgi:hypothetical protein